MTKRRLLLSYCPLVLFLFLGCKSQQDSLLPGETRSAGCLELSPPAPVYCFFEGQAVLQGPTKRICQRTSPDRFILTNPEDVTVTILGGRCFSLLKGDL